MSADVRDLVAGWYRMSWAKAGHVSTHYLRGNGKSWLCGGIPTLIKDRKLIGPLDASDVALAETCQGCLPLRTFDDR
jgi:hypothetical protein